MAKSRKSKASKSNPLAKAVEPAEDPVTLEDIVSDDVPKGATGDVASTDLPKFDVPDDEDGLDMDKSEKASSADKSTDDAKTDDAKAVEDAEVVEETVVETTEVIETDIEVPEDAAPEPSISESDSSDVAVVAAEPVPAKKGGGFFGVLLGGVAAGAIGYGVATYYPLNLGEDTSEEGNELVALIEAQAEQISALEEQIAAIPPADLSGVEAQIAELADQSAASVGELSETVETNFSALDARLIEVEKQPNSDGTLSDTALAAYERELEELRAELTTQQETVMSAAAQAEADLAEARAEAERREQEALEAAENAASRAALNRIATAAESGAPFADALSDLGGDVPAVLADAAQDGVSTNASLIEDFPSVARAALATARSEGASEDASGGGLGSFLRNQFDVRSTVPQEGSSPDAILSRAEAAVKEGRIADALAEIEALPEVARAELTDWTARATERADVLDAIASLSETYN